MEWICCHVTMFSIRRKGATPFTCQTFRRHSCHGCKSICNRKFHLLGQINHGTSWNYDFLLHSFHEVTICDLHANSSDDLITSKGPKRADHGVPPKASPEKKMSFRIYGFTSTSSSFSSSSASSSSSSSSTTSSSQPCPEFLVAWMMNRIILVTWSLTISILNRKIKRMYSVAP